MKLNVQSVWRQDVVWDSGTFSSAIVVVLPECTWMMLCHFFIQVWTKNICNSHNPLEIYNIFLSIWRPNHHWSVSCKRVNKMKGSKHFKASLLNLRVLHPECLQEKKATGASLLSGYKLQIGFLLCVCVFQRCKCCMKFLLISLI